MKQWILLFSVLFFAGCASVEEENAIARKETHIPWAKPADWEGGLPGLGR